MATLYNQAAPRRAVNLSLNSDLVVKARAENLNLSAIAEAAIGQALARAAEAKFRAEIAVSVAEYEAYLDEYGSFADAVRVMAEGVDGET